MMSSYYFIRRVLRRIKATLASRQTLQPRPEPLQAASDPAGEAGLPGEARTNIGTLEQISSEAEAAEAGTAQTRPQQSPERSPVVSIVVVAYNIPRELPRTLMSLAPQYQRHIGSWDYEIIVVDNGSTPPVDQTMIDKFADIVRLVRIDDAPPSPAMAVNRGIAQARGEIIGVMVDGARIVTPGLLHFARHGVKLFPRSVVAALGWYIGADFQRFSLQAGYDRAAEDDLLGTIQWPQDGYRLFEIGTPDESSLNGWLAPISESNALFLSRETWEALGGYDERFDAPGGGLVNLDTFDRALALPGSQLVLLLGEATFHQLHGGVSTNATDTIDRWTGWEAQYREIRGRPYGVPAPKTAPVYIGSLPAPALLHLAWAALQPLPHHPAPLGPSFDAGLWALRPPSIPDDAVAAGLIDILHKEFRAGHFAAAAGLARFVRMRLPGAPEPQRILTLVAGALQSTSIPESAAADYHLAMGDAQRLLGDRSAADQVP